MEPLEDKSKNILIDGQPVDGHKIHSLSGWFLLGEGLAHR